MFDCLLEEKKIELEINKGMEFIIKRIRYTLDEPVEKKKQAQLIFIKAKVISIHPNFFILHLESNYIETFNKQDFFERIKKKTIISLQ